MMEACVLAHPGSDGIPGKVLPTILRLTLIGQMEAWTPDEASVLPLGRKTRALLAILALSAPRPVVRSRLAELLWSRRHEEQARASLRQEIHRLLDALQPAADILNVTRDHVSLRPDQVWIDVAEVLRATPSKPAALDLLKGKLLDEFDGIDPAFDVWLAAEREHLQDRARAIGEGLLRQQVDPEAMIPIAQRLLEIARAPEGAWRALMGAYAARGDRGMAVQAYERCRSVLREKLDAAPSPETQRLLAGIRAGGNGAAARDEGVPADPAPSAHAGVRIGMLPLQMLGTEPSDAHLSLSLADEVTAALAAFRQISPISSSSLQQHGSRDEGGLRRAFGLDYLVDGSVQRSGNRIRITMRLLDLDDGNRVAWAHRFDRDGSDLLSLQDEVAAEIATLLIPEIVTLESQRAATRPLVNASAYDLVARAIPLLARLRRDDFDEAGVLLERALEVEPNFAVAHAWRAFWLTLLVSQGWSTDLEDTRQEAGVLIERAITLDPGDARCLAIAGHVRALLFRQPREALELHERALSMNPNLDMAIGLAGIALTYQGDVEGAGRHFARYARLAPSGPLSFYYDAGMALFETLRRDNGAAIRYGRRSSELNPNYTAGLKHYLSALGHAGLHAEARILLRRLLAAEPGFTIQSVLNLSPFNRPADMSHYMAGLRLAGLPEGHTLVA